MHVDHNMHVIGCNMHVTCTLFRIGKYIITLQIDLGTSLGSKSTAVAVSRPDKQAESLRTRKE